MRIGMLLDKPFPPDPRVANEARSLVAAGHDVRLLCVALDSALPPLEMWQGVQVERARIHPGFYKKAGALALNLPLYFGFFRRALERFVARGAIDALHVHDLPLLSVALEVAGRAGIPVVSDLHENWPAAVATYEYARRFPGRLLISPERWRAYERRHLPRAARVIVVVEEALERMAPLGIPRDHLAVVPNTVHVDEFETFPRDPGIEREWSGHFTVSYLGGFDRHRGLECTVEAVRLLGDEMPDLRLVLVGDGATRAALIQRARALGLESRIAFPGWQPFRSFPSWVMASSVCLIPHVRSEHTDTTIPHKLFHYMLLERPVVATDCRPLKRYVEAAGAGLIYRSNDAEDLAACLRRLRAPALRSSLGANGRRAVLEQHNWARTAETLCALYADLAARQSG